MGSLLLALVAILVGTKVLGEVAQRLRQPAVLGELLAGVLLGASVFGIVNPRDPVIHALSQLGVIILLFVIGLETELSSLMKVGAAAAVVALTGVVVPFVLGYYGALALGLAQTHALVCGAALCATSVGITARVLSELGWLDTDEGRVIIGAAVIDDIIGLIILAVIASVVGGAKMSAISVGRVAGVAIGFVVLAVWAGRFIAAPMFKLVERIPSAGSLGVFGVAFALVLALLAERAGSAMIVGAFAAGLVLYNLPYRQEIKKAANTLGHFFVPVFFASVGAAVNLRALVGGKALALALLLIVVGVAGKVVAGWAPWWFRGDKMLVGIGMIPRGEVGLIFAQMGLTAGAVSSGEYGALMLMVLVTTAVTPPALAWRSERLRSAARPPSS